MPPICFERAVSGCRATAKRSPVTRMTVSKHVAQTVFECLSKHGGEWIVPDGAVVHYDDIVLLELVNVSRASWQPVLAYVRTPHTTIYAPFASF